MDVQLEEKIMKRIITIEIDLTSQSGDPMQLEYKMDEIEAGIRGSADLLN